MKRLVSIVVPVFNEAEVLPAFWDRLSRVVSSSSFGSEVEVIFVDDGSEDSSNSFLSTLAESDHRVRLVTLSKNFGHQAALLAGLELSRGDATVSIDADLQDPPEVIGELIQKWESGADVVLARRIERQGETRFKRWTADIFYRLLHRLSGGLVPRDTADFRLLSREALDAVLAIREPSPYFRGIVAWVGFKREFVDYVRDPRYAGSTKYSLTKMIRLGLSGVTSFSERPLYIITLVGSSSIFISVAGATWVLVGKLINPEQSVSGFATTTLLVLFFGGIQLLSIGTIGVYLGVVSRNTKARPRYVVWGSKSRNLETE